MENESQKEKDANCKWESDGYCTKGLEVGTPPVQFCDVPEDCAEREPRE